MDSDSFGTKFMQFEERSRIEFSETGWKLFSEKIAEFHVSLYACTRREFVGRSEDETTLYYSAKDVERATVRVDLQRFYSRKRRRSLFLVGAMLGSLLTGIFANWAFSDIASTTPSALPWCLLIASVIATTTLYYIQALKEVDP